MLLAGLADRVGLTRALSQATGGVRKRRSRHDPGRTVRDLAVMLADGGDCLADLSALRDQPTLFGDVPSGATAWRALAALDAERLAAVRRARAKARARVWELAGPPRRVILDLDGTLVTAHSEKEGAAGNYKHGFGFHPLLCYEATLQEALAGILRPGNAGANTASDHVEVLDLALAQLPEHVRGPGLLVRADSGEATHAFLDHVVSLGLRFSVGFDLTEPVREAILALPERAWRPALTQEGEQREGAAVAQLALDLEANSWPAGTRAICRRERPHPGAQLPSPTTTATASRSSSPTSRGSGSSASSSSTAPTRSSRTGSPLPGAWRSSRRSRVRAPAAPVGRGESRSDTGSGGQAALGLLVNAASARLRPC